MEELKREEQELLAKLAENRDKQKQLETGEHIVCPLCRTSYRRTSYFDPCPGCTNQKIKEGWLSK